MTLLNIPESRITSKSDDETAYDFGLTVFTSGDKFRFDVGGTATSWMNSEDSFIKRVQFENLNRCFLADHLSKEIEIKNILDEAEGYLKLEKYSKAIDCLDEVIYYDKNYAEALLLKSNALFGQGHFVKALRHYKKALKANAYLKDIEYHKLLLQNANEERSNFPRIKRNIYRGDELFEAGDFNRALESYDKALEDSSKFKSKILHKLLSKKGTVLFNLKKFDNAMECFEKSLQVRSTDYAYFMDGFCRYCLGLAVDDSFLKPLRISKDRQLYRALILNEIKMHEDAIRCIDDLLAVHFSPDKLYFIALSCKISARDSLGMDVHAEKRLMDSL